MRNTRRSPCTSSFPSFPEARPTFWRAPSAIDVVHVPYKGAPEIATSRLLGQTQFAFPTFSTALPQVNGGKRRALGVTGARRDPQRTDVPTMMEAVKWDKVVRDSGAKVD
jgi:hypothetical protein